MLYFFNYLLSFKGANSIHSPYIFEFYSTLRSKKKYPDFERIESCRSKLLALHQQIEFVDPGASGKNQIKKYRISSIAKKSLKPSWQGQQFFRIVNKYKPQNILELGTSLGITTMYLAAPDSIATVTTLEGVEPIAQIASQNFKDLNFNNIRLVEGNIDNTLTETVQSLKSIDLVFIDANHTSSAMEKYFETILCCSNNETIFLIDDIYWSEDTKSGWEKLKSHDKVTSSINLYYYGVIFIRREMSKEHFTLYNL